MLVDQMTKRFAVPDLAKCYYNARSHYFFSNEARVSDTINLLRAAEIKQTNKTRVAILVGESNFLSLLPELALHADLVVFADSDPFLIAHVAHMKKCFDDASSPDEFLKYYQINHPIDGQMFIASPEDWFIEKAERFCGILVEHKELDGCNEFYFLASEERYQACKQAFNNLLFTQIKVNLFDQESLLACSALFKQFDAEVTLCNLTNVLEYYGPDYGRDEMRQQFASALKQFVCPDSNSVLILYSKARVLGRF